MPLRKGYISFIKRKRKQKRKIESNKKEKKTKRNAACCSSVQSYAGLDHFIFLVTTREKQLKIRKGTKKEYVKKTGINEWINKERVTSKSSKVFYSDTGYLCLMPIPLYVAVVGTVLIFRIILIT